MLTIQQLIRQASNLAEYYVRLLVRRQKRRRRLPTSRPALYQRLDAARRHLLYAADVSYRPTA